MLHFITLLLHLLACDDTGIARDTGGHVDIIGDTQGDVGIIKDTCDDIFIKRDILLMGN